MPSESGSGESSELKLDRRDPATLAWPMRQYPIFAELLPRSMAAAGGRGCAVLGSEHCFATFVRARFHCAAVAAAFGGSSPESIESVVYDRDRPPTEVRFIAFTVWRMIHSTVSDSCMLLREGIDDLHLLLYFLSRPCDWVEAACREAERSVAECRQAVIETVEETHRSFYARYYDSVAEAFAVSQEDTMKHAERLDWDDLKRQGTIEFI